MVGAELRSGKLVADRAYWFEIACRGGYRRPPDVTASSRAQLAQQLHRAGALQNLDEFLGPARQRSLNLWLPANTARHVDGASLTYFDRDEFRRHQRRRDDAGEASTFHCVGADFVEVAASPAKYNAAAVTVMSLISRFLLAHAKSEPLSTYVQTRLPDPRVPATR